MTYLEYKLGHPAPSLESAWPIAKEALRDFATGPNFWAHMETAFGKGLDFQKAAALAADWGAGDFSGLPEIEVRPGSEIKGAMGAFSGDTNTIYFSQEYLSANAGNSEAVAAVWLEEVGHFVDSVVNSEDAAGDEGDIFSRLVRGDVLSGLELELLKGEDDTVEILGGEVKVEANQEVSFSKAINLDVGDRPIEVAVGEFNDDRVSDLAVANGFSHNVSVLLGNGNGSFSNATNFNAENFGISVAVGKFDDDRISDLAVANWWSDSVSVLLGNGNGSFSSATNFAVGDAPHSVAAGDFNGDRIPDLVAANNGGNVSVLLGNGNGSFSSATNFAVGDAPIFVTIGEFNDDRISDLAVANLRSHNVSVLLGNGNGSFSNATNFAVGNGPRGVAVEDFNGDGISDMAVANGYSDNVSVLLGNGNGSFSDATYFNVGDGPFAVAVGDFNDDRISDLVTANVSSDNVSVLLGNGDGSFRNAINFNVGDGSRSVAVGDFNGDRLPDLVTANENSDNVSILFNNTKPVQQSGKGSNKKDNIEGSNKKDNINGKGGNDKIEAGGGNDKVNGGQGNDNLDGGQGKDNLIGGQGNDVLDGGKGADKLEGGAGDDTYYIDNIGDIVIEVSAGRAFATGGTATATATGDTVNTSVSVSAGTASASSAKISHFVENIILTGKKAINATTGKGNNDITGNKAKNIIKSGSGDDKIDGGGGGDRLEGGSGIDQLEGKDGNDTLIGGPGNDFLDGGKGNDLLNGNAGNDVLVGNFGKDTLTGGPGDDLFFLEEKTSVAKKSAAQIIKDFDKSSDFIGLDGGLTEEDISLKKSGNSTVIEVKKTGKILAVVEKTKPQDLKWRFVSVDGEPEAIQNLETFATPKVKQKSGNTYEMTMNGSEGSKYLSTIKKTEKEVYVQRIKFTPQGGVQTTITFNKDGTRAEAQTNDSSRKWIFEHEDNNSVAVSVVEPGSKKPIEVAKVKVKPDEEEDNANYDELCAAGKEFCKNLGTIKQIFDIIPVAATGGVGAAVQGGLEIADIGCMVMFGDDTDLAKKAADKVLNKASDGIFKGLEGRYTKWSNKKIDESMNSDLGKEISKKVNNKAAKEFFGKTNKSVQDHTTDVMSGVLNWAADKSGIPRGKVLANLRKELGIDWCDKEKEPPTGVKEPPTEVKEPTTEEKEVRVYFQPQGNPWAISKLYLVSPEEKFIGTAPNSMSGLGNDAGKWVSLGTFPVGTELEFETRVTRGPLDRGRTNLTGGFTLSSKSPDTASVNDAGSLTWLGFEDGSSGTWLGVQVEKPGDFNDTLLNIDNVTAKGNSIFVA